ncbi:unnamed protein product [Periconia digitata]|uniref:Multiple RNA-binding domain-containing protein 1 n=1 Tax=Periconia digitata TaxID=1303443 RepID=A0A9W4UP41_9PLEO|nr:unnamed protein product [Periconia digitata]
MATAMESSRIFVRGLPPKFTEDDVRKHFGKFPVTDVKYFPARRIGYVGYKSPQDASLAIKYFNKSFIRMSKIFVEMARPIADKELHMSRRAQKEQRSQPRHDEYIPPSFDNNLKRKREEVQQDPKLREYLEVMQPRSKTNVWANEEAMIEGAADPATPTQDAVIDTPAGDSDDEYQVIAKKVKTAQPTPASERVTVEDVSVVNRRDEPEPEPATESLEEDTATEQAPLTDADWLRSRTNRVLDLVEDDDEGVPPPKAEPQSHHVVEDSPETAEKQTAETSNEAKAEDVATELTEEEKIRETGRLYLRNLSYEISQEDLRQQFSKYGTLDEVHVPSTKSDGKGKGFAFLQFDDPEHAVEAYKENDGVIFQGRLLHILSGKAKRNDELDEFAISKLPLKKQKEVMRRKNASAHSFNWNSLYLNTDAVMSAVAQRLNLSKADLLDHTSSDAAVKQAQAETHVIQETKNYFAKHGVDLEAFKKSSKGDVAILVKNIPHGVSAVEVQKLFEEHGEVKRFLYPPLGMTAIIEFSNATQAKTAFAALSYKKMKDSILYLEKAPKDLFKEGAVAPALHAVPSDDKIGAKLSATDLLEEESRPEASNVATLHVKNLNFSTTTQKLTQTFSPLAGFRSAVVRSKIDPKRGVLSLGYGFVEFNNVEAATAALRAMDGHNLEGHALKIQASHRGADAAEERRRDDAAKKAPGTKILIKNLPFEATKKDIRALFAPYGALRSVRVPKKFDSSSRGFGFAEYSTQRDATNAMNALKNTHLLGRRLVLTFAETESDDPEKELEKMQQKVGSQANKVALQQLTSGGRKKFNVTGTDDLDAA